MKIVGINIEAAGGHSLVSVTAMFAQGEALEEADVARMLDLAREAAGSDKVSREPAQGSTESAKQEVPAEPAETGRRRRHQNPLGDGETGEKPDPTEVAPQGRRRRAAASTTSEASAPKSEDAAEGETSAGSVGRRRRSVASSKPTGETEASGSSAPPATQSPSEGGRRRRRTVEDAADEKAEREADPTPPVSAAAGRRVRGKPTATETNASDDDKITDVDLMRACSKAAEKIGATLVKELLASYEVGRASEIFDAHRKRFLKDLTALVKKES